MKRVELTEEFIMNYWLQKYHNITVKELIKKEPELIKSSDWYKKYAVSQEAHDEWYNWAIDIISKTFRMSKKYIKRGFCFDYLNCAPNIIKNAKISKT